MSNSFNVEGESAVMVTPVVSCLFFSGLRPRSWSWSSRKQQASPSVRSPATQERSSEKSLTRLTSCCRENWWRQGASLSPPLSIRRAWNLSATNWRRSLWWVHVLLCDYIVLCYAMLKIHLLLLIWVQNAKQGYLNTIILAVIGVECVLNPPQKTFKTP